MKKKTKDIIAYAILLLFLLLLGGAACIAAPTQLKFALLTCAIATPFIIGVIWAVAHVASNWTDD